MKSKGDNLSERLRKYWEEKKELIDRALDRFLPKESEEPSILHKSMRYTLFAGGKRLRPLLSIIGYELSGGKELEEILPISCSLELIHTFSLIHDDLPAMDDDDYRRGKLSNHKVFGEGIAILAGDALFSYAFKLIAESPLSSEKKIGVLREVTVATGSDGMIGGQVMDLLAEKMKPTPELVKYIHLRKTGKLIETSLRVGGIVAGADEDIISFFSSVGRKMGIAFQIVDDILDEIGEKKRVGKEVGKDKIKGKCTYVKVFGLEGAKRDANLLRDSIRKEVNEFLGIEEGWKLIELADFIVDRAY